ncbi:hypothetical protein VPH35_064458 [Triticum aestivum]
MLARCQPHKVQLREAGSERRRLWDVLLVFDGEGHMYLGPGWKHFTCAHDLQLGHFLVFLYDGNAMFTVKMFDNTMCRMYYQHDDDASKLSASLFLNGSSSGDDEEQSGEEEEQSRDDEEQSGEEEERSGEVWPILADDDLAMVVADNDLAMVVDDDDPAMVVDDDLAIVVPNADLAMVLPDDNLAMVVASAIPQLGDRTMPIVVEEYIRVGIRHSERIRMMKENKEKNE